MQGVSGNSAKSGLKPGDTIIYASSWFGDELWPADSPQFVNTALARAPSPVYFTYVQGDNVDYPVKRLPKKPAPARFGRRLTASQKERATHICVDCGFIYCALQVLTDHTHYFISHCIVAELKACCTIKHPIRIASLRDLMHTHVHQSMVNAQYLTRPACADVCRRPTAFRRN
jgi:hypothetical protein